MDCNIELKPSRLEDLRYVWDHMRVEDEKEQTTEAGISPELLCLPDMHPITAFVKGVPAFAFGYRIQNHVINVWGLGTETATKRVRVLSKYSRVWFKMLAEEYPGFIIQIAVFGDNEPRYRWHLRMGFEPIDFKYHGYRFMRYKRV